MGVSLKILPPEGRDIILAGALISISLNPVTFLGSRLIFELFENSKFLSRFFDMRDEDALAHLTEEEVEELRRTVILVGAGQVGEYICDNIEAKNTELVIIETNRQKGCQNFL